MLLHILIVKIIAGDFPAIQIVFIRCLASSIILLPLFITQKRLSEMNQDLGLNALRVGFTTLAITINFFTISQIQLAQVSTIGYLRPAVVSVIAWCFLGEQQSWYRWGVIAASFAAIWLIFSPESSFLQLVALLAVAGMFCGSAATILQKHLSKTMRLAADGLLFNRRRHHIMPICGVFLEIPKRRNLDIDDYDRAISNQRPAIFHPRIS